MLEKLKALHAVFVKYSDAPDTKYNQHSERLYFQFSNDGFDEDDLRVVLVFQRYRNSKQDRRKYLNLLNTVGDLPWFTSTHGEARAWERNLIKKKTERDKVLEASGRAAEVPEQRPRHISEVIKTIV